MYAFIVVGMTGQGKSPWVKKYIDGKNCFVFDVQNEYGKKTKYPGEAIINLSDNVNDKRARYFNPKNIKRFIELCETKRNTICVFEEATIFFQGRISSDTRSLIVGKMHTRNVYIFLFHSIADIPPGIMRICNYVILFKTSDELIYVERKFPRLINYFKYISNMPDGSFVNIKMI